MNGKLIVLEGTDASGKSTQFARLCETLDARGVEYRRLVFPQYDQPSSALIRMYLGGEFGSKPEDVSAYAASTFFAVDRYASFKKDWGEYYRSGGLILADRYTTSNAVHQAAKLPASEKDAYLNWLFDFEYRIMGLPKPDAVFFLDMPPQAVRDLLAHRVGKTEDIHEKDADYLEQCYLTASSLAERFEWKRIQCVKNQKLRTIEDIAGEILSDVLNLIAL